MRKTLKEKRNIVEAKSTCQTEPSIQQTSSVKADAENEAPNLKFKKTDKNSQIPPRKQKSYKSAATRTRVVTKHIGGKSNREIAREEGIDRATVGRILSHDEAIKKIRGYRFDILRLLPRTIDVFKDLLESKDEKVRLAVVSKTIEWLKVFNKDDLWSEPPMPEQENDGKKRFLGQVVEMVMAKGQEYNLPSLDMLGVTDLGELRREPARSPAADPEDDPYINTILAKRSDLSV